MEFFNNMYGNTPDKWKNSLTGTDRLRVITNYLTRVRYCKRKGKLNLNEKMSPKSYDKSFKFKPWFEHLHPDWQSEKIIFGHWASLQGNCPVDNVFALDTGCVWGGKLTLMRLDNNQLIQCECS
jgi:bis(5'-nucleosyl)-tetraphosphatase (symmetrical)